MTILLDEALNGFEKRLRDLSRPCFAAFFATAGEWLLPLYEVFSTAQRWGSPQVISEGLEVVWECLATGKELDVAHNFFDRLESVTPHGDDFDAPESTYAQDVVICVDAALRAVTPGQALDTRWVEYVLEPAQAMATEKSSGVLGSGDYVVQMVWEDQLVNLSPIAESLLLCERIMAVLLPMRSVTGDTVVALRRLAVQARPIILNSVGMR